MNKFYPVIFIGMHRSGTSMTTRLLEKLGLFVGRKKLSNPESESSYFTGLSDWLLYQSGGTWYHPEPIRHLLDNKEVLDLSKNYIHFLMKTPHAVSFLGIDKYIRFRSIFNLNIPWGWKDPRSTYTLPLWLDLFPKARVIHVFRHGVDVAKSLQVRYEKNLAYGKIQYKKRKQFYRFIRKSSGFVSGIRCSSLESGFLLWEEYIKEARKHVQNLGDRAIEIKYEDLLMRPHDLLFDMANFCGLNVSNDEIAKIVEVEQVRNDRAYVYRKNHELQIFSEQLDERLKKQGY